MTKRDGLAGDDIRIIIDGQAGELWMGGYEGLTSLYRGHFKRWTEPDGLPSSNIRSLYEDADGVLWIGTYDRGLERLQDGRFTRLSTREGLFDNGVFQILEDTEGYLWMSCNRGIYRVLKKEITEYAQGKRSVISSIAYGKSDGMLNAECNGGLSPAGITTRDGELWFPTQDGIAVIDPRRIQTNLRPPPVAIESVFVDQQARSADRTIVIQPAQENLAIEYSAPSLVNSERIRFRYKLSGQDRDWVNVYGRRTAYYSHLQPGEYDFRVIAANADGIWNMAGAQIHISVLPHFYQRWWFVLSVLSASGGLLAFAWRSRVRQLEAARTAQQSFSRQLIALHESERKHIAAELHDSLGQQLVVIRNWASLALSGMDEPNPLRRPLDEISEMASQVIDEVREIAYNLRPFQLERFGLTAAIEDLVDQVAASSAIRLEAEIDPINEEFNKDEAIHVYRIIQEGLSNITRHSMATEARLLIKKVEGQLFVTISDNGRGFILSGHQAQSGHSGFGLMGVEERVRILGGKWQVESSLGSGTIIKVLIGIRKN
jgi:signal transduction histidine kinase